MRLRDRVQVFGQDDKQKKLLNRLHEEFEKCQARSQSRHNTQHHWQRQQW